MSAYFWVLAFFLFIGLIVWSAFRGSEEQEMSRRIGVFVDEVQRRPIHQTGIRPYIRRKTLIIAHEAGEGWRSLKSDLGDYSASGVEDRVQTVVVFKCRWTSVGTYSNAGSAEVHVCDGEIIDIADAQAAVKFTDFSVHGPGPPQSIKRAPGSRKGEKGGVAYEAAAQSVAKLDRR